MVLQKLINLVVIRIWKLVINSNNLILLLAESLPLANSWFSFFASICIFPQTWSSYSFTSYSFCFSFFFLNFLGQKEGTWFCSVKLHWKISCFPWMGEFEIKKVHFVDCFMRNLNLNKLNRKVFWGEVCWVWGGVCVLYLFKESSCMSV